MKRVSTLLLAFMLLVTAVFATVCHANEESAECAAVENGPTDEMLAQRAKELGLEYVPGLQGEDRYYSRYGEPIYPPNDGALGTPEPVVLKAGTILTRYGRVKGSYFGNEEDTFAQRSLPRTTDVSQYHQYRLKRICRQKRQLLHLGLVSQEGVFSTKYLMRFLLNLMNICR